MNQGRYRLVFNEQSGSWVAVSEITSARGKRASKTTRAIALGVAASIGLAPLTVSAWVEPRAAAPSSSGPRAAAAAVRSSMNASTLPVLQGACGSTGSARCNTSYVTRIGGAASDSSYDYRRLQMTQTGSSETYDWASFNVGTKAWVDFEMPKDGKALNLIHDAAPSVIRGKLTTNADHPENTGASVYLINTNGILFDGSSQVSVGNLVASALRITDGAKNGGLAFDSLTLKESTPSAAFEFAALDGSALDPGLFSGAFIRVEKGAQIQTGEGGRAFLFGARVENAGNISTPGGQTTLAAGAKIYLTASDTSSLRGMLVEVDPLKLSDGTSIGGSVQNEKADTVSYTDDAGKAITKTTGIDAERGNITLQGLIVNQSGRLRATSTVTENGSIYLKAGDTLAGTNARTDDKDQTLYKPQSMRTGVVTLDAGSSTSVELQSSYDSSAKERELSGAQTYTASGILVSGRTIAVQGRSDTDAGARIEAKGGKVAIEASLGKDTTGTPLSSLDSADVSTRVVIGNGANIDVSGVENVAVPVSKNIIEVELRSNELTDSPLLRDSAIRGKTVSVDVRKGSPIIANLDDYEKSRVTKNIAQLNTNAGSIDISSSGDVLVQQGANFDVSGGSTAWQGGNLNVSYLTRTGAAPVEIAKADSNTLYDGIKTGTRYEASYMEGGNAGSVKIQGARRVVMQGDVSGRITIGRDQRELAARPGGASLEISARDSAFNITKTPTTSLASSDAPLPDSSDIAAGVFGDQNVANLKISTLGDIQLAGNAELRSSAGGSVDLSGTRVGIDGSIILPGGGINITGATTINGQLSTSGLWSNETLPVADTGPVVLNGGNISVSGPLTLGKDAKLDVSGGAQHLAATQTRLGNAGKITLDDELTLAGEAGLASLGDHLAGYAYAWNGKQGKGGALSITSPNGFDISTDGSGQRFGPDSIRYDALNTLLFTQGGFVAYDIAATNINVMAGSVIAPRGLVRQLSAAGLRKSGGVVSADMYATSNPNPYSAPARSVALTAQFFGGGHEDVDHDAGILDVANGARIDAGEGGKVTLKAGNRIAVDGRIVAPGGSISLTQTGPLKPPGDNPVVYDSHRKIWLGEHASLEAQGYVRSQLDASGHLIGTVYSGGSVSMDAQKGSIIVQPGASVDVSGTSATLDVNGVPTLLGSRGGNVGMSATEGGIRFEGAIKANGGAGSPGGSVSIEQVNGELALRQSIAGTTADLRKDAAIDESWRNASMIAADTLNASGADTVSMGDSSDNSTTRISIQGNTTLNISGSVAMEAASISSSGSGDVSINSGLVSLGFSRGSAAGSDAIDGSTAGGELNVNAQGILLNNKLALNGFSSTTLRAAQTIELRGFHNQGEKYAGGLYTTGQLNFKTPLVYASTLSDFTLSSLTGIRFDKLDGNATALSAGSRITVQAPLIEQNGVLQAPLGQIVLKGDKVVLGDGSLTSVAGDGTVLFGSTANSGAEWQYTQTATSITLSQLPEKGVSIEAGNIDQKSGASIDLSGGGNLKGWEFVPGTGGSKDVLANSSSAQLYAILPSLGTQFAPFDLQTSTQSAGNGLKAGDVLHLDGSALGLPAGNYTLLPARYALLPGATVVQIVSSKTDVQSNGGTVDITGVASAPGRLGRLQADGSVALDTRNVQIKLMSPDWARSHSEYLESDAGKFFADKGETRSTEDAGRLGLKATSINLEGSIAARHNSDAHGLAVDIAADAVEIRDERPATPKSGVLTLSFEQINRLGADSVLIGGQRSDTADGVVLDTRSSSVDVQSASGSGKLDQSADVILAASSNVSIDHSGIEAKAGSARLDSVTVRGNGALLRVANSDDASVARTGVADSSGLLLNVGSGAKLNGQSVTLDTSASGTLAGQITLGSLASDGSRSGGNLTLAANEVRLGDAPASGSALSLDAARLAALGNPSGLRLRGYEQIMLGNLTLGSSTLKSLALDTPLLTSPGAGSDTHLAAQSLTLANTTGRVVATPATSSSGTLDIAASDITLAGNTTMKVGGYATVNYRADNYLRLAGKPASGTTPVEHVVAGALNVTTPWIVGADGAHQTLRAADTLRLFAPEGGASEAPAAGTAATLKFVGVNGLDFNTSLRAPAGTVTLATEADGAELRIRANGLIDASSSTQTFGDTTRSTDAGTVTLAAPNGNIISEAGSMIDVSGKQDANAGSLVVGGSNIAITASDASTTTTVSTAARNVQLLGSLRGSTESASASGASFRLDTQRVLDASGARTSSLDALNARLNEGDFTEERSFRLRSGSVSIGDTGSSISPTTMSAATITVAADNGAITIGNATLKGQEIGLYANNAGGDTADIDGIHRGAMADGSTAGSIHLTSGAKLDASNPDGSGGKVTLSVSASGNTEAELDVRSARATIQLDGGAVIDVHGIDGAHGGTVTLRAPRFTVPGDWSPVGANIVSVGADSSPVQKALDATGGVLVDKYMSGEYARVTGSISSASGTASTVTGTVGTSGKVVIVDVPIDIASLSSGMLFTIQLSGTVVKPTGLGVPTEYLRIRLAGDDRLATSLSSLKDATGSVPLTRKLVDGGTYVVKVMADSSDLLGWKFVLQLDTGGVTASKAVTSYSLAGYDSKTSGALSVPLTGDTVYFTPGYGNVGAVAVSVAGGTSTWLKYRNADGTLGDLAAGDLVTGSTYAARFDGTQWVTTQKGAVDTYRVADTHFSASDLGVLSFRADAANNNAAWIYVPGNLPIQWKSDTDAAQGKDAIKAGGNTDLVYLASRNSFYSKPASSTAIELSDPGKGLIAGTQVVFSLAASGSGSAPLNLDLNGTGGRALTGSGSTPVTADQLTAGTPYVAIYDGSTWQLAGNETRVGIRNDGASIIGSSQSIAEAYRIYRRNGDWSIGATDLAQLQRDNQVFASKATAIPGFELRAGSELRSTGGMNIDTSIDLRDAGWQYSVAGGDATPTALTLRAGGNLFVSSPIGDGVSADGKLITANSAAMTLTGGADLDAAETTQTAGNGTLTIAGRVRTGNGSLKLASAGDMTITAPVYTTGLYDAPGNVSAAPGTAQFNAGVFGHEGGNISVQAGGKLSGNSGAFTVNNWLITQYTAGRNGTAWWASMDSFNGVGTLGGGSLKVQAGGDLVNLGLFTSSNGRLPFVGGKLVADNLKLQGGGDLSVTTGGDIRDASFGSDLGRSDIRVAGSVNNLKLAISDDPDASSRDMRLHAGGDVNISRLYNPGLNGGANLFDRYGNAGASIVSNGGSISLGTASGLVPADTMLAPSRLNLTAFGGDIDLALSELIITPDLNAQLELLARRNLALPVSGLFMQDLDRSVMPSVSAPGALPGLNRDLNAEAASAHTASVSARDASPVRLVAQEGNLYGHADARSYPEGDKDTIPPSTVFVPKSIVVEAGQDLIGFRLVSQNLSDADVTRISAGRDIRFDITNAGLLADATNERTAGIMVGGPGGLEVTAGRDINLGYSRGILTRGNNMNPRLPERGAAVMVMAGLRQADFLNYFASGYTPDGSLDIRSYDEVITRLLQAKTGDASLTSADAYRQLKVLPRAEADALMQEALATSGVRGAMLDYVRKTLGRSDIAASDTQTRFASLTPAQQSAFWSALTATPASGTIDAAVLKFMASRTPGLSDADARTAFAALPDAERSKLVRDLFFTALRDAGIAGDTSKRDADYEKGYRAIAALFPGTPSDMNVLREGVPLVPYKGDLLLYNSQIKTEQSTATAGASDPWTQGGIDIFAPGGSVNAGLVVAGGTKEASELGVVTVDGGPIRSYVLNDFLVNTSRVFTLNGGDIDIWATNISGGKGSKAAVATPPPRLVIRGDQVFLDVSNAVAGSGIRILASRDNSPASNLYLFAPLGNVDAGDAGFGSTGKVFISAKTVSNADNISAAGGVSGAPLAAPATPVAPAPKPPTDAADANKILDKDPTSAGKARSSILTVEVVSDLGAAEQLLRKQPTAAGKRSECDEKEDTTAACNKTK